MTEKEQYKIKTFCRNCDYVGEAAIPLGTEVKDASCPNCGCKTLHKKTTI